MSRKGHTPRREVQLDPKFHSQTVADLINMVMRHGKKSLAERIVYGAIDDLVGKSDNDPVELLEKALGNVQPMVEVKSRRVGGATYQVPVEVRPRRRTTLAMRWAIDAARKRGEKTMAKRLAAELKEATENRGSAVRKKEETHRMAEANKAFAHYRW